MADHSNSNTYFNWLARAGLITKGIIYCLVGIIGFMAALNMGTSASQTDKSGVLQIIKQQTGGQVLLGAVAFGLVCYGLWRAIQAIVDTEKKGSSAKAIFTRIRFFISGLIYVSFAWAAIQLLVSGLSSSDNDNRRFVQELLSKPFGQWLVGIVAIIIAGIGIYQCYYGLSEKFRKHVNKSVTPINRSLVYSTGKIGFMARGLVWLAIGVLFAKAAVFSSSSQAGSTGKAFQFLAESSYGKYVVAALGIGLVFYGAFNFVRARYETFELHPSIVK